MGDEDFKIFLEDFLDSLNAEEAKIAKLKRQIEKLLGPIEIKATLPEETFSILKWQDEKGERLGDFQAAYKNMNIPDKWNHAYNILKNNNATIANSFHELGYQFRYWIFPSKYDDRIFRKKLNEAKV
jgi:hypothetical protein